MLDTLAKIYDHGRPLVSATVARFEDDPQFITGVELCFGLVRATFRANEDDDTLVAAIAPLVANADETLVDVSASQPWSNCIGLGACWLWQLTNQQGYTDGVRLEFSEPGKPSRVVIEMIVAASAIQIFVSQTCDAT